MGFNCCENCGEPFIYRGGPELCDACDKKVFGPIKEYLEKHPNATIAEVHLDTKTPIPKILSYVRDGRIDVLGKKR